jgi:hypothetical protein
MMSEAALLAELREDVKEWKLNLRSLAAELNRLADRSDTLGDRAPSNGVLIGSTAHHIDRLAIVIATKRRALVVP